MKVRRTTVLRALHAHPLAFHNGRPRRASRWAVANVGSELRAVHFADSDRVTPAAEGAMLVCPGCGCHHAVTAAHARKVERGVRSARCDSCIATRLFHAERAPLTETESCRYTRWWLEQYEDAELADLALALGVEAATIENVARARARL